MDLHRGEGPVARFSPDRRYRYLLTRQVGMLGDRTVTFLMLNPSTADEVKNDPTIRRCIGYATRWTVYRWLHIVNLSPLRATFPRDLIAAGPEPAEVWDKNVATILEAARAADLVVLAYGNHGAREGRADRVLDALEEAGITTHCLGVTGAGHPGHSLYLRSDLDPKLYVRPTRPKDRTG